MYRVNQCLACSSSHLTEIPALVAPFIAAFLHRQRSRGTDLMECRDCSFRFFAERYDDAEIHRLYNQYRGKEYLQVRHEHEFWYTEKINNAMGAAPEEIEVRKTRTFQLVTRHRQASAIRTVLDYGGDRGQFIPDLPAAQKFIFEISGPVPVPGVVLISTDADLKRGAYDVILLGHVLEHCANPLETLFALKRLLNARGGIVLIELPYERYNFSLLPKKGWLKKLYRAYLGLLVNSSRLLTCVDFYSTAFRVKFNFVPPLGFVKLHEHINFFNDSSLKALLERAGLVPLEFSTINLSSTNQFGKHLYCVAQINRPSG